MRIPSRRVLLEWSNLTSEAYALLFKCGASLLIVHLTLQGLGVRQSQVSVVINDDVSEGCSNVLRH